MAGFFPTQIVKSHFVITLPMSSKRIHFLSCLSAIIPSSSGCPGSNASIPRSTGHPKRLNLLYFPHTMNLHHHSPNPHAIQNHEDLNRKDLNHNKPPNHLQSLPQSSNRLQSPTRHNHPILLMDPNQCPSR